MHLFDLNRKKKIICALSFIENWKYVRFAWDINHIL